MRPDRLPLFPLNMVLFPGEQLPLHIFEQRYRRMARACIDQHTPFGIVLAHSDGTTKVGCTAEIIEVTQRYSDGRLDIITVGREPFRVLEFFKETLLLEGEVEYPEDRDTEAPPALKTELVSLYETCHTLLFADLPQDFALAAPGTLAYSIASALPVDLLWKQQILELRAESEREERLLAYLRGWAPHLLKVQARHQTAGGKGHGLN
jgi:Lon protease-like protein